MDTKRLIIYTKHLRSNSVYFYFGSVSESSSDMNELSAIAYQKKKMLVKSIKINWW